MMKRLYLAGAGLAMLLVCNGCGRGESGFTREQYRAAATALFEKELYLEAVDMYREYLRSDVIPPEDVPKVLYQMGTILQENLRDPKAALAQYAVIKALYPGETFNNQLGKRMVASLEAMGRSVDATQARSRLTDFNPDTAAAPGSGAVVAEVDGRKVTLGEIASAAGKVPEAPLERNQLVREYVAQMLIAEAARRKGLADRPEVKLRLGQVEDQILAQAALAEEIKVAPPEGNDLRYYFEANRSRYLQGPDSGGTFETLEPKLRADWTREKQMGEYGKYVDRLMQTAQVRFYGAGDGAPAP